MARIVIELTNRCNLRCAHCFDERHACSGDLPIEIVDTVLLDARRCGIDHVSFTGGEPTLHGHFQEIVRRVCEAGCTFSFVSNGSTFSRIYPLLLRYRSSFAVVTFSLDGAREATHDRLRGHGSYRQVLRAASVCVVVDLPFTLNMTLTAHSRGEVGEMVSLASRLGSRGVRFGHLMQTRRTEQHGLNLDSDARRAVETEIWALQRSAPIAVGMAPGYFSESPLFPCAPLELEEFNVDYRGRLTLCCQLSGHAGSANGADIVADLRKVSLADACETFYQRVAQYQADKRQRVSRGEFGPLDHFPCLYCVNYIAALSRPTSIAGHRQTHR